MRVHTRTRRTDSEVVRGAPSSDAILRQCRAEVLHRQDRLGLVLRQSNQHCTTASDAVCRLARDDDRDSPWPCRGLGACRPFCSRPASLPSSCGRTGTRRLKWTRRIVAPRATAVASCRARISVHPTPCQDASELGSARTLSRPTSRILRAGDKSRSPRPGSVRAGGQRGC